VQRPLISTVIPTFNRRALVCRAIDCALAQTYPNQEIIVVDDGSTDGTGDLLREQYGDRLVYVPQPNGGVSRARNRGMSLARGELIALLDSDDEWDATKLAKQAAFLEQHPDYGMVLCDVRRIDGQRRPIDVFERRSVIPHDGDVLEFVMQNPSLVPASAMFRRAVYSHLGGFDESLRTAEDIELHLRIAANYKIGVIPEPLTTAMRGHEGLSADPDSDFDYVRVMEGFIAAHTDRIPRPVRRRALFRAYERNSRSAFMSGRYLRGWSFLFKGIRTAGRAGDLYSLLRTIRIFVRVTLVRLAAAAGIRGRRNK
jgi:glycosyltransferase involved in cell wall biosynthesis